MSRLVVGLDVGTQGVKLIAYDGAARRTLATHGHPLELQAGDDGRREQRAEAWIDAIVACFAQLDAATRARVVAIGVSGQQHGFVPLDAAGRVLAPVKLWCDTSSQRECDEIMAAAGGARRCVEIAGNPILAGYTASKLPWTRRHRPEVYRQLATILLPHDYVNFWLTGEYWMECGDASGTGWLDVRTRRWSMEMLAATDPERDLSACLPPLVVPEASFPIAPAIAGRLGLPRSVRVSAGGGDNMMAAIGTGNIAPRMLGMSLGTSGTLFTHADRPVVDDAARWAAFCTSDGGWLPLVCTMNCTVATESVARTFGFDARDGDASMAGTAPGAGGLVMLPFLNGERTPDLPHARGSLHGMDLDNLTHANLYRAAMEGATYALRHGYEALGTAGLRFDAIRLTGGGSRSANWRQMVADVFALPVDVPLQAEGAAFGAALQALRAHDLAGGDRTELASVVREHVQVDPRLSVRPDPENIARYREPYHRFLRYLDAARSLYANPQAVAAT
ncbi:xylulokinase [Pinirhizobacter soli]|uniref:xylulokinase n=1 Tax=Pinirhizobacter soli TaxID=2786953 RepID=UPI00202A1797|nr:xylulokinase [Pinirhizobacter soli]